MSAESRQPCKVARAAQEYGIESLDERLVEKRQQEGLSLRDMEEYIGISMLRRVMEQADIEFVESDPERYYRLLAEGDEESGLAVEQVRRRLRAAGVDVDAVLEDVPSYQTIRHHLNDCLGEDTSGRKGTPPNPRRAEATVRALATRTEQVVQKTLNRMRKHGVRHTGAVEVNTIINVT